MNEESDVVRMAREANLYLTSDERIKAVERFAALVRADEREECARICQEQTAYTEFAEEGKDLADMIRARKNNG